MSTSKGRKKYRIRKGRVAMAAGVLFLIIGLIVFVCIRAGKKHHNNSDTQETVDYNAVVPKGQFVKVELEDCNMYIGSELDLKCTSEPEEYASKVIWTSSDEDVVTVDGNPHVTAGNNLVQVCRIGGNADFFAGIYVAGRQVAGRVNFHIAAGTNQLGNHVSQA